MIGFVRCTKNDYSNANYTLGKDYYVSGKAIETNYALNLELYSEPEDVLDNTFEFALCEFKRV